MLMLMMRQYASTRLIEHFSHIELSQNSSPTVAGEDVWNTPQAKKWSNKYIGVAFLSNRVNHQKSTSFYM
jgi:hypothetical protein